MIDPLTLIDLLNIIGIVISGLALLFIISLMIYLVYMAYLRRIILEYKTCNEQQLERWGEILNIKRRKAESANDYRNRLTNALKRF